jgi:hypothetical protein
MQLTLAEFNISDTMVTLCATRSSSSSGSTTLVTSMPPTSYSAGMHINTSPSIGNHSHTVLQDRTQASAVGPRCMHWASSRGDTRLNYLQQL